MQARADARLLGTALAGEQPLEPRGELAPVLRDHLLKEGVLGREEVVEGALGETRPPGHVLHAQRAEALVAQQLPADVQHAKAQPPALLLGKNRRHDRLPLVSSPHFDRINVTDFLNLVILWVRVAYIRVRQVSPPTARPKGTSVNKQSTSPSSPAELSKGQKNLALVVILCMTLMEMLNTTIANVALPTLQTAFEVDMALVQWVSSTLLVVSCAFLLTFGRLGDMIGKVRVFQFGVVTFTVGSLLSALAPSLPILIAARAVQGLGIAASMANNQGIITEMFADSRGRALGLLATFTALGAMSGPTIGGTLVSIAPWRVIFLINVPIGIVSFLVGLRVLPNRRPAERKRFDVKGAVLLSPAILLFFAAITLMQKGFSPLHAVMLAAAAVLLVLFVIVERRESDPLINMDVFKNLGFDACLLTAVCVFLALSGITVISPFYLQQAMGIAPGVAGAIVATYSLVNAIVGPISGTISDKIGCNIPVVVGAALFALGLSLFASLSLDTPIPLIVAIMMGTSLGSAIFQAPNNSLIMSHAKPEMLGFVGSLGNLMRYLGQSLGITVSMALLYGNMSDVAGYRVTAYIPERPDVFITGMSRTFLILMGLVIVGIVITLVRIFVLDRREGHTS